MLKALHVSVFSVEQEGSEDTLDSCYVLHMSSPSPRSCSRPGLVAISGSNGLVRLYEATPAGSLSLAATARGLAGAVVTGVSCAGESPLVSACADDGRIVVWDSRDGLQSAAVSLRAPSGGDVSCVALRDDCRAMAAGRGERVVVWDLASPRSPARVFAETHTADVTSVMFHPAAPDKLLSGSIDGLVCAVDIMAPQQQATTMTGEDEGPDDGDALFLTLSTGHPVESFSVLGPSNDFVGIVTCDEQFSVWQLDTAFRTVLLESARESVSVPGRGYSAEHIVGSHYDASLHAAMLVSASTTGTAAVHAISIESGQVAAVAELPSSPSAGHTAQMRCYSVVGNSLVTGGEDSRICLWGRADDQAPQPIQGQGDAVPSAGEQRRRGERDGDDDGECEDPRKSTKRVSPYGRH